MCVKNKKDTFDLFYQRKKFYKDTCYLCKNKLKTFVGCSKGSGRAETSWKASFKCFLVIYLKLFTEYEVFIFIQSNKISKNMYS